MKYEIQLLILFIAVLGAMNSAQAADKIYLNWGQGINLGQETTGRARTVAGLVKLTADQIGYEEVNSMAGLKLTQSELDAFDPEDQHRISMIAEKLCKDARVLRESASGASKAHEMHEKAEEALEIYYMINPFEWSISPTQRLLIRLRLIRKAREDLLTADTHLDRELELLNVRKHLFDLRKKRFEKQLRSNF